MHRHGFPVLFVCLDGRWQLGEVQQSISIETLWQKGAHQHSLLRTV